MRRTLQHPARLVPLAFLGAVVVGTLLMMLPGARVEPGGTPFVTALFTATSAVCVTGLSVVDTATYWTGFGQVLLTVLTQIGGFGIMALATLLALLVSQRLGLRSRLMAQAEDSSLKLGDVRWVLGRIALTQAAFEIVIAVIVGGRFWLGYDFPLGKAAWYGVFHAVQAFNNAGFALFSNSLVGFVDDAWICVPLTIGVIAGGIGYPVLFELFREIGKPSKWSTHTRLTVFGGIVLLVFGFLTILGLEWNNPGTLGPLGVGEKVLAAFFQDAMTRSGGFNTVDVGAFHSETLAVSTGLMFIGGGSASTAGGIKLTTFFLLAFVILAELRGEPDVVIGKRRIAESTQRQAITVALLGVGLVAAGTFGLLEATDGVAFDAALFEVTSAFATVGLSTGITPTLPNSGQIILVVLMFIGRVGTIAVGSAIALNTQRRLYRYAEERPIVG
ncbi:potassium uptake TrkH family protein [Asanoa ferruginea]|uniref:Potassium uptake TrkH family protein n=1 Tax=Asanoa ferruginea TaxID=53367 RepID=A0A3D9ZDS6_9ACTN|nr:potassium transporter TrkG [Asanoa ferruginea]REF95471.1 potassium uptake TrkH family protein [Asanoa ferruginea]GIF46739.1 potassium transporter Trk [Asanoa ferruginea]